jgi:hypothetical protein
MSARPRHALIAFLFFSLALGLHAQASAANSDDSQISAEEVVVKTNIERVGNTTRITYRVENESLFSLRVVRKSMLDQFCSKPERLATGAVFEFLFTHTNGEEPGLIAVDLAACDIHSGAKPAPPEEATGPLSVETLLRTLTAQLTFGPISEDETSIAADVTGNVLRITYEVRDGAAFSQTEKRTHLMDEACAEGSLLFLLQEGAVLESFYRRPNGEVLALLAVDEAACKARANAQ